MFFRKLPRNKLEYALQKQNKSFFWNPKDGIPNIGDYLAAETVSYFINLHDKDAVEIKKGKILSIGSVLHFAKTGDVIWGSGRNGKISNDSHKFENLDVRAVRGPLTRAYLETKGVNVPEIFGDPAILCPFIYPEEILCPEGPTEDILVVPQLNDDLSKYNAFEDKLVSPRQMPAAFIKQILSAKKIISSSLHGIILAEAYGREAIFYKSGSGETDFKYDDYYKGTGRNEFVFFDNINDCIEAEMPPISNLKNRQKALIKAFPVDRY